MPALPREPAENCSECVHREGRLFCNFSPQVLEAFDEVGAHVSYPGRATVFHEGRRASSVFVVCSGQLKLSASSRDGRTMILKIAVPGDVLGLGAVLSDQPYEVTAETLEPCELKSIQRKEFLAILDSHGQIGKHSAHSLAREYNDAFLDARRLSLSGSATARVAQLLLDWARSSDCGTNQLRFTMALTHEELANMAGTSRETVTRLLNQFERDGVIERRGSTILILESAKMEAWIN